MTGVRRKTSRRRRGFRRLLTTAAVATVVAVAVVVWTWRVPVRRLMNRRVNSDTYDAIVQDAGLRHGISPFLVKAVIQRESSFRPWVIGKAGEVGLMQITTPAIRDWERETGRRCRLKALALNPSLNVEIGAWYLAKAVRRYEDYSNGVILALAQYNAGPSRARDWAPENRAADVTLELIRLPSTREYIRRVLEHRRLFEKEHDDSEHRQACERAAHPAPG